MRQSRVRALLLGLLVAAIVLTSCSAGGRAPSTEAADSAASYAPAAPAAEMPAATAAPVKETAGYATDDAGVPSEVEVQERMIIRTGELVGRFVSVEEAVNQVEALATEAGGYVVTSNLWRSGELLNANMSVRVPADRFDPMMTSFAALAETVERTSTNGQDVTEEYYDIEARLRALRATKEQLLLLLEDVRESMQKAEDILAVYRELQSIQSQIEQYQGRQQYLDRMVAMSTINIQLLAVEAPTPVVSGKWQPMSTLRSALRALTDTGQFLLDALIWVIFYLTPLLALILIPLGLILLGVRALVRRRHRNAKPTADGEDKPAS